MIENLNYEIYGSYCYNDKDWNCLRYGRLYTWEAAQKACPPGWRLPSDEEWWNMAKLYGMADKAQIHKKASKFAYRVLE